MEDLNRMALELVDEAIDFADELAINIVELDNGAVVLDFGVEAPGGIEAGLLLSEIQTGGLATVQTTIESIRDVPLMHIETRTDHPALALLCAQKSGWEISINGFEALGSGPARAIMGEEDIFQQTGYSESTDYAVLVLESTTLPTAEEAEYLAAQLDVPTASLFIPTFSTASITGSVCLAGRSCELTAYRLVELGYKPHHMLSISGLSPVAPVAPDEETAIARTNDALVYGSQTHAILEESFNQFESLPSSASNIEEYGESFSTIFEAYEWDFYSIPESLFAPAEVSLDVVGGEFTKVGKRNTTVIMSSFDL